MDLFPVGLCVGAHVSTPAGISVAVNPITAALLGTFLLREPVGVDLTIGVVFVLVGIRVKTGRSSKIGHRE